MSNSRSTLLVTAAKRHMLGTFSVCCRHDPVTSAFDRDSRETGWWSLELSDSQSFGLVNIVGHSYPPRRLPVASFFLLSLDSEVTRVVTRRHLRLLSPVRCAVSASCAALRPGKQAARSGGGGGAATPPRKLHLVVGRHGDATTKVSSWFLCVRDSDGQMAGVRAGSQSGAVIL